MNERIIGGLVPEHDPPHTIEAPARAAGADAVGLPYLAPEYEDPDWRRIEVTANRFLDHIAGGIGTALERHTGIELGTARCIAHALGRGIGRESHLADFARTGEGTYALLREEYLRLRNAPDAPEWVREQIDWLGTFLIRREHPGARTVDYVEQYPVTLDRLLVPTGIEIGDWYVTVNVPGIYGSAQIAELRETLIDLAIDRDAALRAFLSLPDVNAMSSDIMGDFDRNYYGAFRNEEDALVALCDLDERERDVTDYAAERRLLIDGVTPDYEALREEVSELYDLVEEEGRCYVFNR